MTRQDSSRTTCIFSGTGARAFLFVIRQEPAVAFVDFLASVEPRKFYEELCLEVFAE